MNMFRNIVTVLLFALALGVFLTDPADWKWADPMGSQVVMALRFLGEAKPFSYILLAVVALALFMTRKQY